MSHEHHHHECCEHEHEHHLEHHHEHEHEHHHHEHSLKKQLSLIVITAILLVIAVLIEKNLSLSVAIAPGLPRALSAHWPRHPERGLEGLMHRDIFNEHFLMSIATIGALCIGFSPGAETEFPEAVFVMLFFQVGELFEGYAEGKSRDSIAHLMDIRPDVAHLEETGRQGDRELQDISPEAVVVGSIIVIRPGEKVPLDGIVVEAPPHLTPSPLRVRACLVRSA